MSKRENESLINPALELICAGEEHADLLREKAVHYVSLASRSLSEIDEQMTTDEMGSHIANTLFTLFACGFGEGVKAGNAKRN